MDVPSNTSDAMLDDDELERQDRTFAASGQASIMTFDEVLDAGRCPWCQSYEGDWPGRHAQKAHPDEWEAYR